MSPESRIWNPRSGQRQSVVDGDISARPSPDLVALHRAGIRAYLGAPLITGGGDIAGLVLALFREARSPDARAIRLMSLYVPVAANSIDAARRHRGVQQDLDQSHRALAQEQLARAEAERANRMKDAFLAKVSHDLRTPTSTIIGWAHILGGPSLDGATMRRGLEAIARNARGQAQLLEDALDVARAMAGDLYLASEPVDLAPVLDVAVGAVRLEAEARGIRVEVAANSRVGPVAGEVKRLEQVVRYLVARAVRIAPSGGQVSVRLERAGDHAEITVTDGSDTVPELATGVLEPLDQPASPPSDHHDGPGLGWWIAHYLVKLHGGTVAARSGGEGCPASVTARFPLVEARRGTAGRQQASPAGRPG